jgi:hypothetical protein
MQGREIDLDKLIRANELTPAVGNMNVNARGDQLGNGGTIVKKREEVVAEYYDVKAPRKKQVVADTNMATAPVVKKNKTVQSEVDKGDEE